MIFSSWRSEVCEPICVLSCSGSPTRIASALAAKRSTNSSWTAACTSVRDAAMHDCPAAEKIPYAERRTASSRSASAKTMFGDLPPSSNVTSFSVSEALAAICLPVSVDPVKAILSTPACSTSAAPARRPKPGRMLTTPGGRSRSSISEANASADTGVSSAGLRTIALPPASAGQSFHASMISGEFHGMIAPTTPTGSRRV